VRDNGVYWKPMGRSIMISNGECVSMCVCALSVCANMRNHSVVKCEIKSILVGGGGLGVHM